MKLSRHNHTVIINGFENDHITKTIEHQNDFYEWQMLNALKVYLEPDCLVIDAGANIGNHTLFFAAVCGARVIAYEPIPATAALLRFNAAQNNLSSRIRVREIGLSDSAGVATIGKQISGNAGATTLLKGRGNITLNLLDQEKIAERISLIKVDVEGMDVAVLEGAVGLISRDRPVIVCEAANEEALARLIVFASEIGYIFNGQYNATPTYILVPYRTPIEQTVANQRSSSLLVQTNLSTRDLYYQNSLLRKQIKNLEDRISVLEDMPLET